MQGVDFALKSRDCLVNGNVGGHYLFAVYCELSHELSLTSIAEAGKTLS
jgi:hypothetical protein